jgi:hypothetical protein
VSADRPTLPVLSESGYSTLLSAVATELQEYFSEGTRREDIIANVTALRRAAYARGTARDLFYADLVSAIARKRLRNTPGAMGM